MKEFMEKVSALAAQMAELAVLDAPDAPRVAFTVETALRDGQSAVRVMLDFPADTVGKRNRWGMAPTLSELDEPEVLSLLDDMARVLAERLAAVKGGRH